MPSVRRWLPFSLNVTLRSSGGFGPALAHGRYELFFVLSHLPDKHLIGGILVCGCPEHHFREDWREIDSLRGERVNKLAAIRGVALGGDDSVSDQLLQPVRQNIRSDFLIGTEEFFIRSESPQHHVANNQQRPAIAQYLDRSVQRTPRPPLGIRLLPGHVSTLTHFHLHLASKIWHSFSRAHFSRRGKPSGSLRFAGSAHLITCAIHKEE